MAPALLALAGALSWGIGDFFGGLSSRRLHVLTVLALSQAVGLGGVLLSVLLSGDAFPGVGELLPAAAAGAAGAVGLLVAVAVTLGAAGVVAVLGALYPLATLVLARLVLGERLALSRRVGGVLALAGAALVAVG